MNSAATSAEKNFGEKAEEENWEGKRVIPLELDATIPADVRE